MGMPRAVRNAEPRIEVPRQGGQTEECRKRIAEDIEKMGAELERKKKRWFNLSMRRRAKGKRPGKWRGRRQDEHQHGRRIIFIKRVAGTVGRSLENKMRSAVVN